VVQSEDGGSGAALDKVFDQQIDTFRDLLNTGRPNTAADMLLDLEGRLPDTASPAVRSRIRANVGFARMRQDRDTEAAAFLRDANDLNPTDRKAQANLALASILEGDFAAAMTKLGRSSTEASRAVRSDTR
jgi:Tfp pilus assembly protein PilF